MNRPNAKLILAIYLKGRSLDPSEITSILGIDATKSWCFGQQSQTSTMKLITAKTGLWAYVVESDTLSVTELVKSLRERFIDCGHLLRSLPKVEESYIDLFIGYENDDSTGGEYYFELDRNDISSIHSMNLPFRITVAAIAP